MKKTGGRWSPDERGKFFCPLEWSKSELAFFDCLGSERTDVLLAVTAAPKLGDPSLKRVAENNNLFLDSGVFSLAMRTAKTKGLSHDEALQLHPSAIEGYDKNMEKYRGMLDELKNILWGYVEVDYGGREMKKAVRAELEQDGYQPIPVFHAAIDGWDYFRELDEQYDRICLGSMVKASSAQRLEYLARVARERKHCKWIHSLGVTPTGHWVSCPTESCDSTGYKVSFMFGGPSQGLAQWKQIKDHSLDYGRNEYHSLVACCVAEAATWSQQVNHKLQNEPDIYHR